MTFARVRPPSIVFGDRLWSSDELAARAVGWLEVLPDAVPPGAGSTALAMANHPDSAALFFALSSLGRPVVMLPPDPATWRTAPPIPGNTPVFLTPGLHALAEPARSLGLGVVALEEPRPPSQARTEPSFLATPGVVVFTSGSTGAPKPIHLAMSGIRHQIDALAGACGLVPGDAIAGGLPLAAPFGLVRNLLVAAVLGSTLGLLERFDHRRLLELFASGPYVHWVGTPLMADALTRAPLSRARPPVPRSCHVGTGRLSARVYEAFWRRFGVRLRPAYGLAEAGAVTMETAPDDAIRAGCVGHACPGVELRIGDDPLDPEPPDRPGRIWLRSPWLMEGYGFPPDLAPREHREGWWRTQDVGTLDVDGYLTLIGRADDCFKTSSGHLVNPGEIASALMGHAGVTDVVVLPIPRGADGVMIGALVEGASAPGAEALRATSARELPPWSRPQVVELIERLPRLPGGKPDRAACAAILFRAAGLSS